MPVCRPTRSLLLQGTPGHQLSPPGGRRDEHGHAGPVQRCLTMQPTTDWLCLMKCSLFSGQDWHRTGWPSLFQLSWLKACFCCFVLFCFMPPRHRMKRCMSEQLCEPRLEIKDTVVEMLGAQRQHQPKGIRPVLNYFPGC